MGPALKKKKKKKKGREKKMRREKNSLKISKKAYVKSEMGSAMTTTVACFFHCRPLSQ